MDEREGEREKGGRVIWKKEREREREIESCETSLNWI